MKDKRRKKASFIVPLIITIVIALLPRFNPRIIDEYLETLLVVYRFEIRNLIAPPAVPGNIVIVSIDEQSLSEVGRWPWSRKVQADLIGSIFKGEPKAVAVDVFYPEKQTPDSDNTLARILNEHRDKLIVALGFEVEQGRAFNGEVNDILFDQAVARIENSQLVDRYSFKAHRVLLPHEPIGSAAPLGHVYTLPDSNGVLTWEYLYLKYGDEYFASLALKTAAVAEGVDFDRIRIIGGEGVEIGETLVPSDEVGRLHINYYGKELTFPYISAVDVLNGKVPHKFIRDKVVLVGTSAMGTYDQKVTPFSANMPGVEKNATVIANILSRDFMKRSAPHMDILFVLISGMIAMSIGRGNRALQASLYYVMLIFFILAINQSLFMLQGVRYNLVYPLFTVLSIGAFTTSYKYFIEERTSREIRKMFSSYVTERVVNELIKNPDMARLGGERREVTVLFSDISGFTSYSERHKPEDVVSILNEYLAAMTEIIFKWEGTLDKFIGDAIVAFWGAPLEQKNHAELAVRCALHMIEGLEALRQKWIAEGREPLSMGIGLNTGEVLVGNIGAEGKKMDYTVIGDHVNIGARVEALTREFKTNILITELPLRKISELISASRIGHISIEGVGTVTVKGREEPVKVYAVKSLDPSEKSLITECGEKTIIHMRDK